MKWEGNRQSDNVEDRRDEGGGGGGGGLRFGGGRGIGLGTIVTAHEVGHHAQRQRQLLERGDIEEAMNAAAQIGDDALQRKAQGTVVPESFTHGSSAQRQTWFKRGLDSGAVRECNTFAAQRF